MPVVRTRAKRKRPSVWRRYRGVFVAFVAVVGVVVLYVLLLGPGSKPKLPVAARAVGGAPLAASDSMAMAGNPDAAPRDRAAALPPIRLPADDAPHATGMEWWYYNGHLQGAGGARFAYHVAIFLHDGMVRHTVFHVALTDLRSGKRYTRQIRTAGLPSDKNLPGYSFDYQGWRVSGAGGNHVVSIQEKDFALDLVLKDASPPVLHQAASTATPGVLDFGSGGVSYYYSRPRMQASGTVDVGGTRLPVQGDVWFDHQWGDFDGGGLAWNWFALQLDDGADVMLYQLFSGKGVPILTMGTVTRNQVTVPLSATDISMRPQGVWVSPRTGIRFPAEWELSLPMGVVRVKPVQADSEFDARETTFNVYWEGSVRVSGAAQGKGFLEMSGYDHVPSLQPGAARSQ
nr:lipocalin family protein [uncultured Albidiferax sp.]